MALYKQAGSKVWWYEFEFAGQRIRASTKSTSKTVARNAMEARRRKLETDYNDIKAPERPKLFSVAAKEYIAVSRNRLAERTMMIIERNVKLLLPFLGNKVLCDISPFDIQRIVEARSAQGASNRYTNMTIETLRTILRRNHQWERLRPDYKKLDEPKDCGKELSPEDETKLLDECRKSPSRVLFPAVILALYAGMRSDEIRWLLWRLIDFQNACLSVGKSKTKHGKGRLIPLVGPALQVMKDWAACFPNRLPDHHVFPKERYSLDVKSNVRRISRHNPNNPMGSWKKAWRTAKRRAGVHLRFHDLRHTTVTRLLDAGCTLEQIAPIMGWSARTMAEMMIRYQHRSLEKKRETMSALVTPTNGTEKRPPIGSATVLKQVHECGRYVS